MVTSEAYTAGQYAMVDDRPPRLELHTLGRISIGPEGALDASTLLSQDKRLGIFLYLALARPRGYHRRDVLLGMFWPETEQSRARHALNQTLYVIRQVVGDEHISSRGAELSLNFDHWWIDAEAFREALDEGNPRAALDLYHGPFLNGLYLSGAPEFERWLDHERDVHLRRAITAARQVAKEHIALNDPQGAADHLRWAARVAPYDESLRVDLIRLLVQTGHRSSATKELSCLREDLQELGVDPSEDTEALERELGELNGTAAPSSHSGIVPQPVDLRGGTTRPTLAPSPWHLRRWGVGLVVAAGLVLAAIAVPSLRPTPVSERRAPYQRLLVAPFTVASGEDVDSSLVAGLADWISTAVLSTGLLEVVGPDAVRRLSPVGDERDDTSVINQATHEATQHSRSDIVLIGTIGTRRDSLVWRARLVDPTVSQVLRTVDVVTRADGDPIAGLEMFQDHILGALATVVDHRFSSWAGRSSQPSSYEAYRAFADGFEAYRGREFRRAAASFEVAAGEDGAFTAAVLWAAWAHWNHFQQGMSIHLVRRAPADSILATLQPKRAGMSPWEVALHDHLLATTKYDLQGAYDAVSRMLEHSPDVEWTFRRFHLGKSLDRPNAVLLALEELDSDPQWLGSGEERYWSFKAWAFHRLGRYEDELALARAQWDKDPSNWRGRFYMFRALAGLGRTTEAQAVLAIDLRFPGMMSELHAHGFHQERRARMSEYLSRLEARPVKDRDDEWHYEMGNALGGFDRFGEAAVHLRQIPPDSPRWLDAAGELGWVMAKLGDDEEALRLSAELERIDEAAWRLVLQARIASALGHKDLAVSLLARMSIRGQLHQDLWFPELIGYPPFEEIQRPKG